MKKGFFKIFPTLMLAVGLFVFNGCKKTDSTPEVVVPTITTSTVTAIAQTTANSGGNVTNDGGANITERGLCWSTSQSPSIADSKTSDGTGIGAFTSILTDLKANTTYFVRAFGVNTAGTSYGNEVTFTTPKAPIVYGTVTDQDGNTYKTVVIGTQTWMAENLKTTKYRNGDPISNVENNTNGAYFNYNGSESMAGVYGRLYNWFAVNDSRNIAPTGWHVASTDEWTTLKLYLKDSSACKLKESGDSHWQSSNTNITNETGFTALPGGYRERYLQSYYDLRNMGIWWTSTETSVDNACSILMDCSSVSIKISNSVASSAIKPNGYSVRCVKD